jgi:hypothetical protein
LQGEKGVQGDTGAGIQGETGLIGETGIQGETGAGIQGETGLQGLKGEVGSDGPRGYTGIQGATGISGSPSALPTGFIYFDGTSQDTTNSTFTDIPGLSTTVTLDSSAYIHGLMTFEARSFGLGNYATGGFCVVINDSTGNALDNFILTND